MRLAKDLERQIALELDARTQAALLARVADLYENKIEDIDAAIRVQKQRAEIDEARSDALSAL